MLQLLVHEVLLRVVHGIRVHGHVVHDLAEQLEVGVVLVANVLDDGVQQIQDDSHIAMVFPQLAHEIGNVGFHGFLPSVFWPDGA